MRLVDADRLTDVIELIDWYHLNKNGEMVHGANDDLHQPWYKSDDIYDAIRNAPTVEAIPIEYMQSQVDCGKWAEIIQRWKEHEQDG